MSQERVDSRPSRTGLLARVGLIAAILTSGAGVGYVVGKGDASRPVTTTEKNGINQLDLASISREDIALLEDFIVKENFVELFKQDWGDETEIVAPWSTAMASTYDLRTKSTSADADIMHFLNPGENLSLGFNHVMIPKLDLDNPISGNLFIPSEDVRVFVRTDGNVGAGYRLNDRGSGLSLSIRSLGEYGDVNRPFEIFAEAVVLPNIPSQLQ